MKPVALSRREFGELIGRDVKVVQRLVASGRLPVNADNKLELPGALHAYMRVRGTVAAPAEDAGDDDETQETLNGAQAATRLAAHRTPEEARTIAAAELELKTWRARLLEQRYAREAAQLIPVEEVGADARAAGTSIRNALLALPARCALTIEQAIAEHGQLNAARIERLLGDEINATLEALQRSLYARSQ